MQFAAYTRTDRYPDWAGGHLVTETRDRTGTMSKAWDVEINGEIVGGKVSFSEWTEVYGYRGYGVWITDVAWVANTPAGRRWIGLS